MRDWIDITGWTLLHFAWQGALVGLAVAGVLWLFRRRSANARYAVASGGLVTLLAAPVLTAAVLWQAARMVEPLRRTDRATARELADGSTGSHALIGRDSMDAVHARLAAALPGLVAVWLAGVSLLLVRMGGGLWRVHRLHESGLAASASRWQEVAARLRHASVCWTPYGSWSRVWSARRPSSAGCGRSSCCRSPPSPI